MALNFPGPYEVRIFYSTSVSSVVIQHVQKLNCIIDPDPVAGDAFSTISVIRRDGTPFDLDDEVNDWVTLMRPLFNNGAGNAIDYAELWKYEPESFDASFISTHPIALAGSSATVVNPAGQSIMTFRTQEGGIMKLNFMETVIGTGGIDLAPYTPAGAEAIRAAVVAGTSPWIGRDGSYPFASIAHYPGVNEALFKRRFR